MQSDFSFHENQSTSDGDQEGINIVIKDLQYSSILNIPWYTRWMHMLYAYFAKINACFVTPTIIGYIYFIINIVQSFIPTFFIDIEDIWPSDHLMTLFLKILSFFFQGPSQSIKHARVIISFVFAIIFQASLIFLLIRAKSYQKSGRMTSIEMRAVIIFFKYILPLFCPHLVSGIPISFYQIIVEKNIGINVATIIFSIYSFASFMFILMFAITPRVLLEDIPTHDWISTFGANAIANASLVTIIVGVAGCLHGYLRLICTLPLLIYLLISGIVIFFINPVIKAKIGGVISATTIAAALNAILISINIILHEVSTPITPEIIFVLGIIFYIILLILTRILKAKQLLKLMALFDTLLDRTQNTQEILNDNFKSYNSFVGKIRLALDQWHPYLMSFEIFDFSVTKWPNNFNVLIQYGRVLSFFPNKNSQMMWIASLISKLPDASIRASYLLQFRHISRTRQISTSASIKKQIDDINAKKELLNILLRRFWENILQKNIVNFWDEVEKAQKHINEVDSLLAQLLDDYPNNLDVLIQYFDFTENIKHNHIEANEIAKKIQLLQNNDQIKSDLSFETAVQVFPTLHSFIKAIDETNATRDLLNNTENINATNNIFHDLNSPIRKSSFFNPYALNNNNNNSVEEKEVKNDDHKEEEAGNEHFSSNEESNTQIELALNNLIINSKLGQILFGCLIVGIMTILSIGLFFFYYKSYMSGFINKQKLAIEFLDQIDFTVYDFTYLTHKVSMLPFIFNHESPVTITNSVELMERISPTLYEAGRIPILNITYNETIALLSESKNLFSQMVSSLDLLDIRSPLVKQMVDLLSNNLTEAGLTAKEVANQFLLDVQELMSYTDPASFYSGNVFLRFQNYYYILFNEFSDLATLANQYASSTYDDDFVSLNERMVLVIMITILLVTLPYVLQLFMLHIQSEAIAESFTFFPNTEIRNVLNKFGKGNSASKVDEDSLQAASLSHLTNNGLINMIKLVLTFFSSFAVLSICSLIIYYLAENFIDNASSVTNGIYTLYPSFSSMLNAFTKIARLYMMRLDPQYKNSEAETEEDTYDHAYNMLYQSLELFSSGMWSENGSIIAYFHDNGRSFDYFDDIFPNVENEVPMEKSYFERVATAKFPEAIDILFGYMLSYLQEYSKVTPKTNDPLFLGMLYYFYDFGEINRTKIYCNLVTENAFDQINHYHTQGRACLYITIAWQIVALVMMILYLIERHRCIKRTLLFYHFLHPHIILENRNAMLLIESGKKTLELNNTTFSNADQIISQIGQGIVITERNLSILDFNQAFVQFIQASEEKINGAFLNDLIVKEEGDKSWPLLIQHISEALLGKYPPKFSEIINAVLTNGQSVHFQCNVICLTSHRAANEGDHESIVKIAVIFDDCTDIFLRQHLIQQEQQKIISIMSRVAPPQAISEFEENGDSLSFVSQSISIGQIRVITNKKFQRQSGESFHFYQDIFQMFDNEIKSFDLLCKTRTFIDTYSFAGGLFTNGNKAEHHSEEAVLFALKLIRMESVFSDKVGTQIHFQIGIHTGGPVVAGIMNLSKPAFQVIGSVNEIATQLRSKGMADKIHISRSVYELIFSNGFHIQERGEVELRRGNSMATYYVNP